MKSNFQKIAVLCTCTGLLCSCGQSDNKQEHHKEFIPITILHPTTIEFPRSYVADVQAIQFVEIKPKVEGFVQQIYVDEGQKVKKGQPLFQLSSDQYSETVKEAQANYKQAQAQYEMANYEAERIGRLVDKQILSKIRLDQANKEKEVAQMKVEQAKAQMQRSQMDYSYTTITAPFDGYIDRIPYKTGSLVNPQSLLTTVSDISEIFAYYKVNESEYLEYKRQQLSGQKQHEENNIVVVEAVHVKMHHEKLSPYKASVAAINEIGGAIIAITLVMSAVFVPVGFMQGTVGIFYRQFSLTLAVAIVISGINALTLSPALCALLLKPADGKKKKKAGWLRRFFIFFNRRYDRFEKKYNIGLHKYLSRKIITYATLIIFFLATFGMSQVLPSGFIPNEDQGMIYVNVDAPPGATLERSEKALNAVQAALLPFKEIESISTLAGYSLMTETEGANFGMGMINLTPWSERDQTAAELIEIYKDRTSHIKDADIQFFLPPTVPGFGNASGFELRLQDKTAGSFAEFADVANTLVEKLNEDPRIVGATSGFNPNFPQYLLKVDIAKAAKLGVNLNESMETLQSYIGSFYSSNFIRFGQMYKVMLQASPEYRMNPEDLYKFYAKNKDGNMVPYSNFMTMDRIFGPNQITRYNMFTSALITGEPAEGVSSGEVIEAVEQIAKETLPRGYDIEWSGVTREEKDSGGQTVLIFGICLLFVYLLLAAQYESLLLPFPVILSLPAGIFGSYFFLQLAGLENNIYAQVALVMLIGLLGKNAILIVEMANQYRKQGMSIFDAAVRGSVSRLRPILMTSFAFICGLIPLVMASGAGALGNRSIGTAAAGGMFIGTFVGIFLVPGLYLIFESWSAHLNRNKVSYDEEDEK